MLFNIILVDDESFTLDTLTEIIDFEKFGFNLAGTFYDAQSALDFVKTNRVDAVITDIKMPGISGMDLLREIKAADKKTVVVFLSAHAEFEYASEAIENGIFKYVLKPVTIDSMEKLLISIKDKLMETGAPLYEQQPTFNNCLSPWAQKDFYNYLFKITPVSIEALQEKLNESQFKYNLSSDFCTIADINFLDLESYFAKANNFDYNMLYQSVKNIMCRSDFLVCPLINDYSYIKVLILSDSDSSRGFMKLLKSFSVSLADDLSDILDIQVSVAFSKVFNGISELGIYNRVVINAKNDTESMFEQIRKQKSPRMHILNTLDRIIFEHKQGNGDYLCTFAYYLYQLILQYIEPADLHKFNLYPKALKLPPTLDEVNVPVNIDEFVKLLPQTVENLIKYFSKDTHSAPNTTQKALEYINEHFCEKISLEDVSNHVYCNPTYLSRTIKHSTGLSFTNYLNSLRLTRAEQLLAGSDLTIQEIAGKTGYNSLGYFYRKFKEKNGCSPDSYKRKK